MIYLDKTTEPIRHLQITLAQKIKWISSLQNGFSITSEFSSSFTSPLNDKHVSWVNKFYSGKNYPQLLDLMSICKMLSAIWDILFPHFERNMDGHTFFHISGKYSFWCSHSTKHPWVKYSLLKMVCPFWKMFYGSLPDVLWIFLGIF